MLLSSAAARRARLLLGLMLRLQLLGLAPASKIYKVPRSPWSVVVGPTTAMLVTVRRIQWTAESAAVLAHDQGQRIDLHLNSPRMVGNLV